MKRGLLVLAFFFFGALGLFAQVDYQISQQPNDNEVFACAGETFTLLFRVRDVGTNGFPTQYSITSSNPGEVALVQLDEPLSGVVNNGVQRLIAFQVVVAPNALGPYQITCVANCAGCGPTSQPVDLSFFLEVNTQPNIALEGIPEPEICNGNPITLEAFLENGAYDVDYLWSTNETTPSISVNTGGQYQVKVENACGFDIETLIVLEGSTPEVEYQDCVIEGSDLIIVVSFLDPGDYPMTFQWFENNDLIVDQPTDDYEILQITPTLIQLIVHNIFTNGHDQSLFRVRAANQCGQTISEGCMAVPIELIYFAGKLKNDAVMLQWATASELNNELFTIERSEDGERFLPIGTLPGAGDSYEQLNYSFADHAVAELASLPTVYYRLKQTDYDGAFSYSNVVVITLDGVKDFGIISATLDGANLQLQYHLPADGGIDIQVFDLNGRLYRNVSTLGVEGFNQQGISADDLPAGMYLLRLQDRQRQETVKFVIP